MTEAQSGGRAAGRASNARPLLSESVLVALSGSVNSEQLILAGRRLAETIGTSWEAIHVETPEADGDGITGARAAEALGMAAKNGATIATIPAATVAAGIETHLESSPAKHIVLGGDRTSRWRRIWRGSLLDILMGRPDGLILHVHTRGSPAADGNSRAVPLASRAKIPARNYAYASALVLATLLIAEALQLFTGSRSLDLIFLFPVIAVATRLGLPPALLAAALSVLCYNYFLIVPAFSFDPRAPQNLVMSVVLIAVAAYTSIMTARMRGRLKLSDRSASENASVAALAQRLTRDADWETTALTVCEHVHGLLKVQAIMFREVAGKLAPAAAVPPPGPLGPVDQAALDWAWANGDETGAGTQILSSADWQFQPLKTSLGTLAVLGLAREDGRDPVRPDKRILLSTLVAQAALAHERLVLEDRIRANLR